MTDDRSRRNGVERRPGGRRGTEGVAIFNLIGIALVLITAPLAWLVLDVTRPPAPSASPSIAGAVVSPTPTPLPTPSPTAVLPTATASVSNNFGNGTWSTAVPLDNGRWGAAIALLPGNLVLVAGGTLSDTSKGATASAVIIDPRTGGWTAAHDMTTARAYPMAVNLDPNRVLVMGGSASGKPLDTAEIFDSRTGVWTAAGKMTTPRTHGTATLLEDGRVLVAGGGVTPDPTYKSTRTAEIYDPQKGTWTATGLMLHARALHSATPLADGRVLVAGGADKYHDGGNVTASAEIYDPRTGRWQAAADMGAPRYTHNAVRLASGKVLVAGGWSMTSNSDPSLASAEIYDPAANTWSATGSMSTGRGQFRMAALRDGRVLAAAGVSPSYGVVASADLFDPATGRWTQTGALPEAVMWPAMTGLDDDHGRILLVGGALTASAGRQSNAVSVYDPPAP